MTGPRPLPLPGPRLLQALGLLALLGLPLAWWPALAGGWGLLALIVALLAGLDLWRLARLPTPEAQRLLGEAASLGNPLPVRVVLHNLHDRPLKLDCHDHHPAPCLIEGMPQLGCTLPAKGAYRIEYRITPEERGALEFPGIELRLHAPWGLWSWRRFIPLRQTLRVYPDLTPVARYTLLAAERQLGRMGIRLRRRRGEGQDFHQLREYQHGDPLRQIDWKASARLRRLISREYQLERDQQIVFLLDCGHRMRGRDGLHSNFDHALNAILLMTHVALRQGDAVGLASFSGSARWLPPGKGRLAMSRILDALYDLQPTRQAPDYAAAATRLLLNQRRRALVILVTNLRDEDPAELLPAVRMLQRNHLVLVASLREPVIDRLRSQPVDGFETALRHAAAEDYLQRRQRAIEWLDAHRVLHLDTPPARLATRLVNRYLEIKAAGQL
ncbi:MAG: DUF58 domain-containing protein [Gammaproteobacteria bacterium]|nr:MAG: DUF58 domain-containing protein [Gammaproteobacteria bacterium]